MSGRRPAPPGGWPPPAGARLAGEEIALLPLATAVAEYEASIDGYLEQDEDLAAYVRRLERDGDDLDDDEVADEVTLDPETDAEQMVEDIERFLRDQGSS